MERIAFLVDGFNLYHSLKQAQLALKGQSTRWLDLRSLCASYLPHIGRTATLSSVHYFSALAWHLEPKNPGVTTRHLDYIECLRATGVTIELAKFKQKDSICRACGAKTFRHEEKETDVAIAVRLLELLHQGSCDSAVIVTGDSDIVPAVRCARALFPEQRVFACFPFNRESLELKSVASATFQITKKAYARHQLSDPFAILGGRIVTRPARW